MRITLVCQSKEEAKKRYLETKEHYHQKLGWIDVKIEVVYSMKGAVQKILKA